MKNVASTFENERITSTWRRVVICILITLVGFNLRAVILAVPPVLPLIQHDLKLSYAATGFLTALPVLVLGSSAWPSGLLAERIGPRACVSIGLALLAAGALLRALWPNAISLFAFTLLMSLGIAVAQTAIPILARRWFPMHIGSVTALFSDGLIIGEAVAAGVTVPIMAQFLGKDAWASTFLLWGIPVAVLLLLWLWLAPPASAGIPTLSPLTTNSASKPPHQSETSPGEGVGIPFMASPQGGGVRAHAYLDSPPSTTPPNDQPRVNGLHLGILLGAGSLIYFGMNGWIAPYNQATSHQNLTPLALAILNTAQLPVSLAITLFAQQLAGRRWPFIAAGIICGTSIVAWIFTPATLEPFWAALLGGSSALVFTLGIALPPLLASPDKVARLTGTTISLTYIVAFVGPFVGGELWDLFHLPAIAFLPVALASATLIILGALLPSRANFGLLMHTPHTATTKPDTTIPTTLSPGQHPPIP